MICIELINNKQLKFQNEDEANLFVYCLPNSLKEYLLNTNTIQDDFVSDSLIKHHSEYINNTFKNINLNDEDLAYLLKNTKNINIIIDKLVNLIGVREVYNTISNLKTKNSDLYNETLFALEHIDNTYKDINELNQTEFEQVDSNNYEDVIKTNTASDVTLSITTSVNDKEALVKKSTLEQNKKYIPISIENDLTIDNALIDRIVEDLNNINEEPADERFFEKNTKNQQDLYKTNSIKESVEEFIAWMIGEKHTDKLQDYRQAIIDKIKSGELKNKTIISDEELGEPTYAMALDWIIQNWEKVKNENTLFRKNLKYDNNFINFLIQKGYIKYTDENGNPC